VSVLDGQGDQPQFAITGGIACGKSTVGKLLTRWGVRVLDTDLVGHDVIRPNQPAHDELIQTFGKTIRNSLGEIDRSKLGAIVFEDSEKRTQLNNIVHPRIRDVWVAWMDTRRQRNEPAALLIPLLFESHATWPWDGIVCVSAPEADVLRRLQSRGLDRAEAKQRIAAQLPLAEKETQSDFIITNDKSLTQLEARTRKVLEQLSQRSTSRAKGDRRT